MKRKINQKNLIIILLLIVLLLALAIGYAAFSDLLTISGTANAKGTFDLEFQNEEIVKNVGADLDKTTAVISADKDTLTVNVADLSYPGAGVEFAVDIVNVGTMPAEIQSVTPINVTGSDKIKVTGLDAIKTDHPKLEVGDRCNVHFTVEWPVDAGEIPEAESSISFGLQIEYSQATGEVFDGKATHTDTDKAGNAIATNTTEDDIVEIPENTLVKQIRVEDYGKSINYVAIVKNNKTQENEKVSNWKVLYNDKSNVYLILDGFLPNNLVPTATGLSTSGTYVVNSQTSREALLNGLTTSSYWSEFANGIEGATSQGGPTFEILMKSYNEKHNASMKTDSTIEGTFTIENTDTLYIPYSREWNEITFYWLTDAYPNNSIAMWRVNHDGGISTCIYSSYGTYAGIRPIVKLPTTIEGTVGETVEIK